MVFSNKTYDTLKWIAGYLLPGLATFWLTIGKIWNLSLTTEIGATITAIDVFMAGLLDLSKKNYTGDGEFVINDTDPEKDVYSLKLNGAVEDLSSKDTITFRVKKEG